MAKMTTKTFYEIHYKDGKGTRCFMDSTFDNLYSAEQKVEEFKKEHPEYTDVVIIKVVLTRIETQVR
jgi:hypothetical protein